MLPGAVVLSRTGAAVAADFANATGAPIVGDTTTGRLYWMGVGGMPFPINAITVQVPASGNADAAIQDAVNEAAAATNNSNSVRGAVYLPAAIYNVTSSAVFTPTISTNNRGIKFFGDGWYASIIRYGALTGSTWLYDNGATDRSQFNTFANLGFEGMDPAGFSVYTDIPTNAKGFKITSAGHEQGFKFLQCRFSYLDTAFDMEGSNTASEMIFVQCRFDHIRTSFYTINNLQSFDHEFYGCDLSVLYGDGFSVGASGGGVVKWQGGYINMSSASGADKYLWKNTGTSGVIGSPSAFDRVKMEFLGNTSNLLTTANAAPHNLLFDGCVMSTTATTDLTNFCNCNSQSTVDFDKCNFVEGSTGKYNFALTDTTAFYGLNGSINFSKCKVPTLFSTRFTQASAYGKITGDGNSGTATGAPAAGFHEAFDFNFNWRAATAGQVATWAISGATLQDCGSPVDTNIRTKVAQIKETSEFWPSITEHTLILPVGSIILGIVILMPPGSVDATVTQLQVTNNNKTVTHLQTTAGAFSGTHSAFLSNYYYNVGSAANDYTLRLSVTVATTGVKQGGIVEVTYR